MNLFNLVKKISLFIGVLVFIQNADADSLYDLKSKWLDIENKKTSIGVAEGSYTLISMIYTGCAHACPMTIAKIQNIEKDFSNVGFTKTKFVLASFDVKSDRPEKLKKYQAERKLNTDQWKFLAANSESDARELAVTLGISYKDIGDGDFSHSNMITLLDPKGKVLASINSLNASTEPLVKALQDSLKSDLKK